MYKLHNEPCKICGSKKNYYMESEGRKSLFCEDCNHYEDIYVSDELKQYWEEQAETEEQEKLQQAKFIPKCPICQSTDLSKITSTKKVMKIAAFGIFGMGDNGKTYRCNNCGSKF